MENNSKETQEESRTGESQEINLQLDTNQIASTVFSVTQAPNTVSPADLFGWLKEKKCMQCGNHLAMAKREDKGTKKDVLNCTNCPMTIDFGAYAKLRAYIVEGALETPGGYPLSKRENMFGEQVFEKPKNY
jgi:hypothetical protein